MKKKIMGKRLNLLLCLLITSVLLAAPFGAFAEPAGEETITLHIVKTWDGLRRAAVLCMYKDIDSGDTIKESDWLIGKVGCDYAFAVPIIDDYAYAGLAAGSSPEEGNVPEGGTVVTMLYKKGVPKPDPDPEPEPEPEPEPDPEPEPIIYTVTYHRNDGSGIETVYGPMEAGSEHKIPDEQTGLSRKRYFHFGWSTEPGGGGEVYVLFDYDMNPLMPAILIESDLDLYAVWLPIE